MRILFAGSPVIAVASLEVLCKTDGIEVIGVLTNPDSPRGRHGTPQPTELAESAQGFLNNGLGDFPILKPAKLDAEVREQIKTLKCDLLVSFAYGRLFGPKFLELFPLGGINIHPSLLPKYRGPTPIQAAILNRESVTGISIQTLAKEMDSGDILSCEELPLTGTETTGSLSEMAALKAAQMLPDVIKKIQNGSIRPQPQNHSEASYCKLLTREDGIINWSQSAADIEARIRALNPWPLCRTIHGGRELFILKAGIFNGKTSEGTAGQVLGTDKNDGILIQTGNGILCVTALQYQAKKALLWRDFLNGARDFPGSKLG
jgi:methionyl-tRNA formyltransferase